MPDFTADRRGSAVQWFALAAAILSVASLAGAHGLEWLSRSGHVALVADHAPLPAQDRRMAADPGVDLTPTGSIRPSGGLVLRIR